MSEETKSTARMQADMYHDLLVVMQAAWIEWQRGKGAETAMLWIDSTLDGPGIIPAEDEPYAFDAQKYYGANKSDPAPPCTICGDPSVILEGGLAGCSETHFQQAKAGDQ